MAEVQTQLHAATPVVLPAPWSLRAWLPLAAALAVVLGTLSGIRVSHAKHQDTMAEAYARSIDPIMMNRDGHFH